jgi:hypothetical protein
VSIGDRLRGLREQNNLPLGEVAHRARTRRSYVAGLGEGQLIPMLETLETRASSASLPSVNQHRTASLISSPVEIASLDEFVKGLPAELPVLVPSFFLATISKQGWRPCVVVVSEGQRIVGLLYCKERVMAGIGLRVVFGDNALGTMVAAPPGEIESVLSCGLQALVNNKVALRLQFPPDRIPTLWGIPKNVEVRFCHGRPNAHLELPVSYDQFLAGIGPRTRRNFRYYRRKSDLAGNIYESMADFPTFSSAARRLFPKADYARSEHEMESSLTTIEGMPSRFMVGLRTAAGEWIGLAGGWYVGQRAFMNMQLNDRAYSRMSLSVVLRSYLIEALIAQGIRELVFCGGSSAPLKSYCAYPNVVMVNIDKRSQPWRLARLAWATVEKLVPTAFDKMVRLYLKGL